MITTNATTSLVVETMDRICREDGLEAALEFAALSIDTSVKRIARLQAEIVEVEARKAELEKMAQHTAADYGRAMQAVKDAQLADAKLAEKTLQADYKEAKSDLEALHARQNALVAAEVGADPIATYAGPKAPSAEWNAFYDSTLQSFYDRRSVAYARIGNELGIDAACQTVQAHERNYLRAREARQNLEAALHIEAGRCDGWLAAGAAYSQAVVTADGALVVRLDGKDRYTVAAVADGRVIAASRDAATLAKSMRAANHGSYNVLPLVRVPRIR